nr:hypothetical protein [Tanacetum cinerariifolium]
MAKTINGEAHIHAWVNGKEIIITESSVRRDLRLADEEGVDCLSNSTIFENLELMGTIASAIICLATNQKFNFSKLIFNSMIKNLDNVFGKLLMYPRKPKRKNTQVPQPSGSTKNVADETIHKEWSDRLVRAATTTSSLEAEQDSGNTLQSDEDRMKLNELMKLCINLQSRVLDLEKTKTTQALEITSLKRRVKKLENKQRSRTHKLKRLYKVGLTARVDSSEDEQSLDKDASKQGRKINDIDANEDIILVNDQDDAEMFDVNDFFGKGDILEVFVEKEVADKEVNDEVQKVVEEVVEDTNTAKLIVDAAQVSDAGEVNAASIATTVSAAATITTKEITLAQALVEIKTSKPKAKGIVLQEPKGNKSYYQIIRADGKSKMYMVFNRMLKEFDREDLEDLYNLVKAKYGSTRPVEDLDLLLWGDLKTMFEPHVEDQVWKKQHGYRVLECKLYDSCRVHSLRMQSVHIYMLVEKKYPLTAPTLTDMLNKKPQADYFTEMAYQLLKLITKQLKNP